jgi:hypothetical protein
LTRGVAATPKPTRVPAEGSIPELPTNDNPACETGSRATFRFDDALVRGVAHDSTFADESPL